MKIYVLGLWFTLVLMSACGSSPLNSDKVFKNGSVNANVFNVHDDCELFLRLRKLTVEEGLKPKYKVLEGSYTIDYKAYKAIALSENDVKAVLAGEDSFKSKSEAKLIDSGGGLLSKYICVKKSGQPLYISSDAISNLELYTYGDYEVPGHLCKNEDSGQCVWNGMFYNDFAPSIEIAVKDGKKISDYISYVVVYRNGEFVKGLSRVVDGSEYSRLILNGMELVRRWPTQGAPISIYIAPKVEVENIDVSQFDNVSNLKKSVLDLEGAKKVLLKARLEIVKKAVESSSLNVDVKSAVTSGLDKVDGDVDGWKDVFDRVVNSIRNGGIKVDGSSDLDEEKIKVIDKLNGLKTLLSGDGGLERLKSSIVGLDDEIAKLKDLLANSQVYIDSVKGIVETYKKERLETTFAAYQIASRIALSEDSIFEEKKSNPNLLIEGGVRFDMDYDVGWGDYYYLNPWFGVPIAPNEVDLEFSVLKPTNAIPMFDLIGLRWQPSGHDIRLAIAAMPLGMSELKVDKEGDESKNIYSSGIGGSTAFGSLKFAVMWGCNWNGPKDNDGAFNCGSELDNVRLVFGVDLIKLVTGKSDPDKSDNSQSEQ